MWGFAFVWTMFFVLVNGSLAIVAITFARYIVAGVSETEAEANPLLVILCLVINSILLK